ncbi:MAG: spore coat protein [Gorillibacterium sp.]|nr:spore coat protein [Gorillibacterium sp.]
MNQQQNAQQQKDTLLPEKDWLYTVLCDLKRTAREYTTAVTESNCETVRQEFTKLLNSTLTLQGQLYQLMKQQNMYNTSSPALSQEIQTQVQQYKQSGQEAVQFAQQKTMQPMGNQANSGAVASSTFM